MPSLGWRANGWGILFATHLKAFKCPGEDDVSVRCITWPNEPRVIVDEPCVVHGALDNDSVTPEFCLVLWPSVEVRLMDGHSNVVLEAGGEVVVVHDAPRI